MGNKLPVGDLEIAANSLLHEAQLNEVGNLLRSPEEIPKGPGIYAWWFEKGMFGRVFENTVTRDNLELLYIGIAPARPPRPQQKNPRNLHVRLKNHCLGPIAVSTVRRTLTHLLQQQLLPHLTVRKQKSRMRAEDETALTEWMIKHVRVSWLEHATPWALEDYLLDLGICPLNIKGSPHPFSLELRQQRRHTFSNCD